MSALPDPHAAMQAQFHEALWAQKTPAGLGQEDALDRRFLVYRNNVQHGLRSALSQRFPVIERLVGADFFAAMARVFAANHPPETPVLINWGGAFPAFLEAFPPVAKLPYLPDVARLELARGQAYHAADAPVADPSALGVSDPSALRLILAPSVRAYHSAWPSVSIWAQNQPGAQQAPLPKGPQFALIARTRNFDVPVIALGAADHAVLCRLIAGDPFGQAAAGTDPTAILTLLLQHGLITKIEGDTP